ncbi:LacI family DNA-binding transcriptional regulator [Plantibacter sp. LMC-P-059a]|uniref:LacI family DNA-binding transcriptional regulator n=1 Tax=Plantibacter sp. LMC-P-059a TaxID=3040297 RepID=UPI00254CDE92|nr:LacI family DNA-binding transcriptional regulator [Plantibacter sp. LMC-P-059a]
MAEASRHATIFDVARLAGVSHQTVSRVLNDLPNVRPATKARVEEAIMQLRYVPSPAARTLVTKRSRTIGLIATGGTEFGPSSSVLHFNAAARDARWSVFTANMVDSDPGSARAAVEGFLRQNVEGIAVISAREGVTDIVAGMELSVPLVALHATPRAGLVTVGVDQYAGARAATAHLIRLGHRRIGHLAGPADAVDARERERGWRDELAGAGLVAQLIGTGDWTPTSGYVIGRRLDEEVTAVFAANDQMALGLIHALTEQGVRVPLDFSVVGFDDIPEAEHLSPPLTTVRQDFELVGRTMLATLLDHVNGEPVRTTAPSVPLLQERDSTAAAPTNGRVGQDLARARVD